MNTNTPLHELSDSDFQKLQQRADQFQSELKRTGHPDWTLYLPPPHDPMRLTILCELIKIDLEYAWKTRNPVQLRSYLSRFPELGTIDDLPADLIAEEFRIRYKYDTPLPELDEYAERYPRQFPLVERLIALDDPRKPKADVRAAPGSEYRKPSPNIDSKQLSIGGDYEMIKKLGQGQFGEVWKARAPGGIEVAVKIVPLPTDRRSVSRELQAIEIVKGLRNPYIMTLQAFWTTDDKLFIVMELADRSLRDRCNECRAAGLTGIPPNELLNYFDNAAKGLDYVHKKKILHRDIKPDNILLSGEYAKLADFGLARLQQQHLMSASYAGTPIYMAPEVWGGKVCEQSDLYSLAVSYAEMRLGRRPFSGSDFVEVMQKHLSGTPDLEGMTPQEKEVLQHALAKDPNQRPQTCSQFVELLRLAMAGSLMELPGSPRSLPPLPQNHGTLDPAQVQVLLQQGTAEPDRSTSGIVPEPRLPRRAPLEPQPLSRADTSQLAVSDPGLIPDSPRRQVKSKEKADLPDHLAASISSASSEKLSLSLDSAAPARLPLGDSRDRTPQTISPPLPNRQSSIAPPGMPAWPFLIVGLLLIGVVSGGIYLVVSDSKQRVEKPRFDDPPATARETLPTSTSPAPPGSTTETKKIDSPMKDMEKGEEKEPPIRKPKPWLPPGFSEQSAPTIVINGTEFHRELLGPDANGIRARFLLIVPDARRNEKVEPFYALETKVWNGLFRKFVEEEQQANRALVGLAWKPDESPVEPVSRVRADEAIRFAQWLGGETAHLPTPLQWDVMSGFFRRGDRLGPAQGERIAIQKGKFQPVNETNDDVSAFGIRDLAGNGREFTRQLLEGGLPGRALPVPDLGPDSLIILRGRHYWLERPLTFDRIATEQTMPQVQKALYPSPLTSFRIVIELPKR